MTELHKITKIGIQILETADSVSVNEFMEEKC